MKVLNLQNISLAAAIDAAVFVLRKGGMVIYPTETTYGVGVDVENPQTVEKLLEYKGKRDGKPISVAVADQVMAERYVVRNDTAIKVYKTFLPGPVTVISTGKGIAADGIASPEGKVGIRIPKYDFAIEMIRQFGRGVSATGANASNKKRPYTVQDILDNLSEKQKSLIDLVIDVGELPHNDPSSVIDTTIDDIVVLRQGVVQFESKQTVTTRSEKETITWFSQFALRFRSSYGYRPVLFLFSGEMGAGKTHAVKGLAQGLGIKQMIASPTYATANEYAFQTEGSDRLFVHIDAWKLTDFSQLLDLGVEEYLRENAVIAVEWSERFVTAFSRLEGQAKMISIEMNPGTNENERTITYNL